RGCRGSCGYDDGSTVDGDAAAHGGPDVVGEARPSRVRPRIEELRAGGRRTRDRYDGRGRAPGHEARDPEARRDGGRRGSRGWRGEELDHADAPVAGAGYAGIERAPRVRVLLEGPHRLVVSRIDHRLGVVPP